MRVFYNVCIFISLFAGIYHFKENIGISNNWLICAVFILILRLEEVLKND